MADLRVADLPGDMGEHRGVRPDERVRLEVAVAREGADGEVVASVPDVGQLAHAADVDQHRRRRETQLHQWEQRVAPRQELGVVAVFGELRDRLVSRARPRVVELRGDHGRAS